MIKEIKISNFCSFNAQTFWKNPISLNSNPNILIGINGSGKSNLLKVFKLLKEGVSGVGLKKYIIDGLGGFDNTYFKNRLPADDSIIFEFLFDFKVLNSYGLSLTSDIEYRIEIFNGGGNGSFYVLEKIGSTNGDTYLRFEDGDGFLQDEGNENRKNYRKFVDGSELALAKVFDDERYPVLSTVRKSIDDILIYDYFDTTPRSAIKRPIIATSGKRLTGDGGNLAQILNTIKLNHKTAYRKIVEMLNEVNPNFSGFDFNVIGGSNIELMLDERGLESSIHVSSISDGTLRYLCLLAILYNPERGKFICIDEPEVGLHPDMIRNVARAIKDASENSTIIVSTHSPALLNYFNISELRVFEKDEHNSTKVVTYTEEQFEGWYEIFSCGQMWIAGDFGGVRYGG